MTHKEIELSRLETSFLEIALQIDNEQADKIRSRAEKIGNSEFMEGLTNFEKVMTLFLSFKGFNRNIEALANSTMDKDRRQEFRTDIIAEILNESIDVGVEINEP